MQVLISAHLFTLTTGNLISGRGDLTARTEFFNILRQYFKFIVG